MAALGSLVVKLGLEYAQFTGGLDKSEQAALAASKKIQDTFDGMKRGIAATAGAVAGGLAAAFTVNAFTNLIQGSMQANAALEDLSMQTGASAAALKALVEVGKFNDMGPEQIGAAMNKLAANMAGATEESKGTGKALQALGLDFKTLKAMSPDVQMQTIATAMAKFEDGTGKSAVAMALFGKEGAKMIPMLTDLAEVEDLRTKLTEAQIEAQEKLSAQSANLDDNVVRITQSSEKWKKELAEGMIPALDLGAEAVLDLMNGSGGLREEVRKLAADGSIKQWTMDAIKGLSYVADAGQIAWRVLQSIGKGLGGFAAALVQAINGDFRAAWGILKDSGQDMVDAFDGPTVGERFRVSLEKMSEASKNAGQEAQKATKGQIAFTNSTDQSAKTVAAAKDPFDALRDSILKTTAAYQAEEAAGGKLTEGQKKAIEALDQLRTGKVKVTEAQAIQLGQDIEALLVAEQSNAAREQFIKTADAERAARLKIVTAMEQSAASAAEQNQALRDEIELIGLTEEQQTRVLQQRNEAIILTKEATLAELERANAITGTMTREQIALAAEIKALKERNELLGAKGVKNTAVEAAKKAEDEWKKTTDQINESLTDALMRGFESGKDFAKNMRDTVVNMFKTMVLRPTISAILAPVAGGVTGLLGLSGAANAGQGAGSLMGMASNASSAYNLVRGGLNVASQAGTWLSGKGTELALQYMGESAGTLLNNFALGMSSTSSMSAAAAALQGTGAEIAGLAVGSLMNGFAGYGISKMLSGGYSAGGWVNTAAGIASAIPGVGPIAGVIGGAVNLAFGRKLKDAGIEGTFGGETGFEGNSFEYYKGGLFRSNKTKRSPLDEETRSALADNFNVMRVATAAMADVLGLGTDAISNFTASVKISLKGLSPEDAEKAIQAEFDKIAESLARQTLGTDAFSRAGESSVQTLIRLSSSLTTVNSAFKMLDIEARDLQFANSLTGGKNASEYLDKFGGAAVFNQLTASYYDAFYSEAEKTANVTKSITETLASVGLAMPTTREAFRDLTNEYLAMGIYGAETAAVLLGLSGAFASIVPVTEAVTESVKAMTASLDDYISSNVRDSAQARYLRGLEMVGNTAALKRLGVPGYASGGYHSGGLRLVGENSPELEVTGPSHIISSPATAALLGGQGSDTATVTELKGLRSELQAEIKNLRAEVRAVVVQTAKAADIWERVTPGRNSISIATPYGPVQVATPAGKPLSVDQVT